MAAEDKNIFNYIKDANKSFDFAAMKEEALGRYEELGLENPEATWDELMKSFNPIYLALGSIGGRYVRLPNPQKMKSYVVALRNKISTVAREAAPKLKAVKDKFIQTWRNRFIDKNVKPFSRITPDGSVKMTNERGIQYTKAPKIDNKIKDMSNEKIMENPEIKQYVRGWESEMRQKQYWRVDDEYMKIKGEISKITKGASEKQLLKKYGDDLIKKGDWVKDYVRLDKEGRIIGSDWKRNMMEHEESVKVLRENLEEFKELVKKTYPNIKVK